MIAKYFILYTKLSLTYKISAISLSEKSTISVVLKSYPRHCTRSQKNQECSNAVARKN